MPDGEDWLWRPVAEGLCKYESVITGLVDLEDIAVMHDIIAVRDENQIRIQEHLERTSK